MTRLHGLPASATNSVHIHRTSCRFYYLWPCIPMSTMFWLADLHPAA